MSRSPTPPSRSRLPSQIPARPPELMNIFCSKRPDPCGARLSATLERAYPHDLWMTANHSELKGFYQFSKRGERPDRLGPRGLRPRRSLNCAGFRPIRKRRGRGAKRSQRVIIVLSAKNELTSQLSELL